MAYHGQVPDALMNDLKAAFSPAEIVALSVQIGLMNAGNWFAIATQLRRE